MKNDIVSQIKILTDKKFSGFIKFGIEKGMISNLYISNKLQLNLNPVDDWVKRLTEIADTNYFGTIELEMIDGKITGMDWQRTYKSLDLFQKLKENKNYSERVK